MSRTHRLGYKPWQQRPNKTIWEGKRNFLKRVHNKAARKQAKLTLQGVKSKSISGKVSEVKWKGT